MRSEVKDILVEQLWGDAGVIRHEYAHPAVTASGFYRSRHVLRPESLEGLYHERSSRLEDRSIVCWSVIWWTGMPTPPKGVSLPPQNATFDLYKSVGVPEGALVCVSNSSAVISINLKGLFCCLFYVTDWKCCSVRSLRAWEHWKAYNGMARIVVLVKLFKMLPTLFSIIIFFLFLFLFLFHSSL